MNEAIDPAYLEAGVRKERAKLWADIALIAWQALNPKITIEAAEEAVGDKAGGALNAYCCICVLLLSALYAFF